MAAVIQVVRNAVLGNVNREAELPHALDCAVDPLRIDRVGKVGHQGVVDVNELEGLVRVELKLNVVVRVVVEGGVVIRLGGTVRKRNTKAAKDKEGEEIHHEREDF